MTTGTTNNEDGRSHHFQANGELFFLEILSNYDFIQSNKITKPLKLDRKRLHIINLRWFDPSVFSEY